MASSDNKTVPGGAAVTAFVNAVADPRRRAETRAVMKLLREITGKRPRMWGPSIIGYDRYRYRYESGREGESPMIGLSPRKANLTIYVMPGFEPFADHLARLGRFRTGKSCLYLTRLDDVDADVLAALLRDAYALMRERYGPA